MHLYRQSQQRNSPYGVKKTASVAVAVETDPSRSRPRRRSSGKGSGGGTGTHALPATVRRSVSRARSRAASHRGFSRAPSLRERRKLRLRLLRNLAKARTAYDSPSV
ncbi:hypothetical protein SKAU_G00047880 [Synaphobranchus kaupii]|uniref:Uncharacterized protein n=1 Tax=Synaphobranchus kaupii TaxID=118154 RepID=A0A9Q1J950_SYNKA|nr:hypothetical protein SKAU_G00047880 [Synaphobranchus kaupii]